MKFVLLLIMLFLNVLLQGQVAFQLDLYRQNEILKQNQVLTERVIELAVDSIGYLWIGTSDGAIRFDGHDMDRYQNEGPFGTTLHGNHVYDILARPDSSVWISTYGGGISIYQPYSDNFTTLLSSSNSTSILENRVTGMHAISKDTILIHYRGNDNNAGGFSLLNTDGEILGHQLNKNIQRNGEVIIFVDLSIDDRSIWLPAQQLYQINRSTLSYKTIEYPFPVETWNDIKAIDKLDNETLIIGTKMGLFTYNTLSAEWTTLLSDVQVKTIKSDEHQIYILCEKVIYILNKSNNDLSVYLDATAMYEEDDFRMNDIEINGKDFWLGSDLGLFRFELEEQTVKILKMKTDQNDPIKSIWRFGTNPKNNAKLYIGFEGQILEETGPQQLKAINKISKWVHGRTVSHFLKDGQYLFATDGGLFSYNAITNKVMSFIEHTALQEILKHEGIWSIYNNGLDSILWIGTTSKGLIKYNVDQDTFIQFKHEKDNPNSLCYDNYVSVISPGLDSNLWISTDKGLSIINPKTNQFVYLPTLMDVLGDYIIHDNVAGDQYMWIGTRDHGLFRYDIANDELKSYTIRDGLPFTGANRLIFENGLLFFSTIKGICILEESTDKIRLFDESAGLDHKELYYAKMTIEDNYLMVSEKFSNGIYQIPIEDVNQGSELSPILIESLKTNSSDTSITYFNPAGKLNLTAKEDNFLVKFTNVDFDKRKINYRYKLDGYDEEWISSGEIRTANYSHLAGGRYQLIIQASLAGGKWEQERVIDIQIDKFWYRTWWFYFLCALGSLLTFSILFKLSLDKIKLKESFELMLSQAETKALRAQMNPHFVFNSLNSIKSFIIENDRLNATNYLNKFSKLMRLILNHSESNLIPLSEEIHAIRLYVDMEHLRFASFNFELEIDEKLSPENLMVPPMIIQPYLENAIWHGLQHKVASHGELLLKFDKLNTEGLHVIIRDNGVGRKAASNLKSKSALQKKSHGMAITKERLGLSQLQNGQESVKIIDLFETGISAGTEIRIILPYTNSASA